MADIGGNATTVVFDLGGVLIDWKPERAIAPLYGGDETVAREAIARTQFHAFNLAQDAGRSWADGFAAAKDDDHRAVYRTYLDNLDVAHAVAIDGTVEIVNELFARGVPLVALTNATVEAVASLKRQHPFMSLFSDIVVSAEEKLMKPDAAIFEVLTRRTGRPPEAHIFTDDKPENAEAARRCGLDGHHFTDPAGLRRYLARQGVL